MVNLVVPVDLATGAVESNQTWRADGDQAKPASLSIVSGGASALTPFPAPPITLQEKQATTRFLLACGRLCRSLLRGLLLRLQPLLQRADGLLELIDFLPKLCGLPRRLGAVL
mgnify:CR=1 FL=1